jgi:hypothetical protein
MRDLTVFIDAVGVCGPGFTDWVSASKCLRGEASWSLQPTVIPIPEGLLASERRRVGEAVKIAIAAGRDALKQTNLSTQTLATVFSSSCADGDNCHPICEALAMDERLVSPTRFTNSVHNAPSGYWGIAMQATAASSSVCAFDGSFCAGLLEAATQCLCSQAPVLLIAYETPYPHPLHEKRPILGSMAIALLLAPQASPHSQAKLDISRVTDQSSQMDNRELEKVRVGIPAARGLPLLQQLASRKPGVVILDYLNLQALRTELTPIA